MFILLFRVLHQQAKTSESNAITPRPRQQHSPPPQQQQHQHHEDHTSKYAGKKLNKNLEIILLINFHN